MKMIIFTFPAIVGSVGTAPLLNFAFNQSHLWLSSSAELSSDSGKLMTNFQKSRLTAKNTHRTLCEQT